MKGYGFINDFKFLYKNFGFVVAAKVRLLPVICSKLSSHSYVYYYHRAIISFLKNLLSDVIIKYRRFDESNAKVQALTQNDVIWVCWWQGEDLMPEIVRICYNSIKQNSGTAKVVLITKSNYMDYISLPNRIVRLVEAKQISITHLSDLIRVKLLKKYGGLWIDSTYWVTANLNFKEYSLFTLKQNAPQLCTSVSQMRWAGNFFAIHSGSILMNFLDDSLMKYWVCYERLIDYLILDYLIEIAYEEFASVREKIDALPCTGDNPHWLNYHFNEIFDENIFRKQMILNPYAKLSWKKSYKDSENGQLTYYGYFKKMTNSVR